MKELIDESCVIDLIAQLILTDSKNRDTPWKTQM